MKYHRLLLIVLVLLMPVRAAAWDSATHTALIQLTRNIIYIPGFWESEHTIVLAADAGKRCYEDRTEKLASFPQQRIFLELVCGTDEPDNERRFKPWLNTPHQEKAEEFATTHFHHAVSAYLQRTSDGDATHARSANQLGRSVHFIQDLTDFTKDMDSRSEGRKIRKKSIQIAQAYLESFLTNRRYPQDLAARLDHMRATLGVNYQTPEEVIAGALKDRKEMADTVTQFLKDPAEAGNWESKVNEALVATLAGTIVLQEIWVDLYLNRIGVKR